MRTFRWAGVGIVAVGLACSRRPESPTPSGVGESPAPTAEAARCYQSPASVLLGPARSAGQQGQGPGWIRLDSLATADSGTARLADADGKGLAARWRRGSDLSVVVEGRDDFLRVELRLSTSDPVVAGVGSAHSDAAQERDSLGRLGDLRRTWTLTAQSIACDSMPGSAK